MSGLIGDQQVVAHWDEDLGALVLVGRVAGAAGCAPVAFGPVTVDVDVADPQVLVEMAAPLARPDAPDDEVRSVLRSLLGSRLTAELFQALSARPDRAHRLGDAVDDIERRRREWRRRGTRRPDEGLHPGVGRLALAGLTLDAAHARPTEPEVAAAGLLDRLLGVDALRATGRPLPRPSRRRLLDDALAVLADVDPDDLDEAAAGALADAIERAGRRLRRTAEVAPVVTRFRPAAPPHPLVVRAAPALARPVDERFVATARMSVASEAVDDDRFAAVAGVLRAPVPVLADALGGAVEARWFDRWHVEVDVPDAPPVGATWWVRAVHDDVVVAAAAVHPDARTVLVVPGSAVRVDVTTDPGGPVPSGALVQSSMGFAAGARAARAERLGDRAAAAGHWRRCAQAHEGAGDLLRSQGAMARVRSTAPPTPHPALVVDEVLGAG